MESGLEGSRKWDFDSDWTLSRSRTIPWVDVSAEGGGSEARLKLAKGQWSALSAITGMFACFCALDNGHVLPGSRNDYGAGLSAGHRMTRV